MSWNRIKCAVLGHRYETSDVAASVTCVRCGELRLDIAWQRPTYGYQPNTLVRGANVNPPPTQPRPAPPPPPPTRHVNDARRPERDETQTLKIRVECDGLADLEARTARIHAQWVEIAALQREVGECADAAGP